MTVCWRSLSSLPLRVAAAIAFLLLGLDAVPRFEFVSVPSARVVRIRLYAPAPRPLYTAATDARLRAPTRPGMPRLVLALPSAPNGARPQRPEAAFSPPSAPNEDGRGPRILGEASQDRALTRLRLVIQASWGAFAPFLGAELTLPGDPANTFEQLAQRTIIPALSPAAGLKLAF